MILPWLKVKRTYTAFGNFPGSTSSKFSSKVFGLWRRVDAWDARPLGEDAAVVRNAGGAGILRRGSVKPMPVCALPHSFTLPPFRTAVDCAEPVAFCPDGLARLRVRRVPASGAGETAYEAEAPAGRIIPAPAAVSFYDGDAVPYVLVMSAAAARDYRVRPVGCALVAAGPEGGRLLEGPPDATWEQCRQAPYWSAALKLSLRPASG